MAIRARQNFLSGIISGTITTSTTSLTGTVGSANFPTPAAGYYTPIILNPGYFGATNTTGPEVVFVQPGGSTSVAIVTRGQDGTSATVTGVNIPWVAGPIVSDFDVTNLTSTGTLTLNNGLNVPGAITVGTINSQTDVNAYNLTTNTLTVGTNTVISGNLTVSGTITATNNKFNGSWYSKTLVNSGSLPNGSGIALTAVQVTVSGYSRYMIVANSSYINNFNTSCIVWSYITDYGSNQSTLAYTTLTGMCRANLGNNLIVNYGNNAPVTFYLNAYSDRAFTGSFGAAEISAIGLS
jgi:hypothetical protein